MFALKTKSPAKKLPLTFYYTIQHPKFVNTVSFTPYTENGVYSGTSLVYMTDSTYTKVLKNVILNVVGYRFTKFPPLFKDAYYHETYTVQTPKGTCTAVKTYKDEGVTNATENTNIKFDVIKGSGVFAGATKMDIFYDNLNLRRKIEFY